jgi:UDP-N-acetylglucosamine 2-epimerase (non-hydrolysing)
VLAQTYTVVFPLHPATKARIESYGLEDLLKQITLIEPLGYFDFTKLMKESTAVVTDSGGIQEETTHLGVTCCTLRDNTERPITLTKGTNRLFPLATLRSDDVLEHITSKRTRTPIELWDDKVSARILEVLKTL